MNFLRKQRKDGHRTMVVRFWALPHDGRAVLAPLHGGRAIFATYHPTGKTAR